MLESAEDIYTPKRDFQDALSLAVFCLLSRSLDVAPPHVFKEHDRAHLGVSLISLRTSIFVGFRAATGLAQPLHLAFCQDLGVT